MISIRATCLPNLNPEIVSLALLQSQNAQDAQDAQDVDAKTTREDVRTVAALPALLPIVVITARPPPKGRDGGLRSNINLLFFVAWKHKKDEKAVEKMMIPKPSSLCVLLSIAHPFLHHHHQRERERRELFVVA